MLNKISESIMKEAVKNNNGYDQYAENLLSDSNQNVFIFTKGKLAGKKCIETSFKEWNEAKGTDLKPSNKHIIFYLLDEDGNKASIHMAKTAQFVEVTELADKSARLCCKCGHRVVTDNARLFVVKNVFENKNMPKEIIDQVKAISEDGSLCYQCQWVEYLGEFMKLSEVVKRVNSKQRLIKKVAQKDMEKCAECGKLLDAEEISLNNELNEKGELLCSTHLLKKISKK